MTKGNIPVCELKSNHNPSPEFNFALFYLGLPDGHEETSYLFEDADGESAGAQLTGAEQDERQSLHGVQHSGVRPSLCRYLET